MIPEATECCCKCHLWTDETSMGVVLVVIALLAILWFATGGRR